jgi:transposase
MNEQRATLRQQSKDELIDSIFEMQARMSQLEKRLAELEAKTKRKRKTPKNSSTPPSRSTKANQPKKPAAKRGAKPGHLGRSRRNAEPDVIVECRVEVCPTCGCDLSATTHRQISSSQMIDIPPIRPQVIEARRYGVTCPCCATTHQAEYPAGWNPHRTFGPNLEALVHYLHLAHPLSYQRVVDIVRDVLGLPVSLGAAVNIVRRAQPQFDAAAQAILATIRDSAVIGSDETSARVAGRNAWQWVFQTPESVYFTIEPRRNAAVIHRVIGNHSPVTWVSDLAAAQLKHPALELQICLAHQVRDLQWEIDTRRCAWAYRLQALLSRAMRLGKQRDQIPPHHYGLQVQAIEHACDTLLAQLPTGQDSQRLRRRYLKHRDDLFVFLYRHTVAPTNNASEQALRNSVIYRKVTGGFRTAWGATAYANAASVIETARRRGHNILHTLRVLLEPTPTPLFSFTAQLE